VCGDEDDGDPFVAGQQMTLQLQSVHCRHPYVEEQARTLGQAA
jgi:hypothetical protein